MRAPSDASSYPCPCSQRHACTQSHRRTRARAGAKTACRRDPFSSALCTCSPAPVLSKARISAERIIHSSNSHSCCWQTHHLCSVHHLMQCSPSMQCVHHLCSVFTIDANAVLLAAETYRLCCLQTQGSISSWWSIGHRAAPLHAAHWPYTHTHTHTHTRLCPDVRQEGSVRHTHSYDLWVSLRVELRSPMLTVCCAGCVCVLHA